MTFPLVLNRKRPFLLVTKQPQGEKRELRTDCTLLVTSTHSQTGQLTKMPRGNYVDLR